MGKGMKENQIMVVVKEPHKAPYVEPLFPNDLKAFQEKVGGYIETFTIASDLTIMCNDEGRLLGLPFNTWICGVDFCGTIIAVGVKGDELASIKAEYIPTVLQLLGGRDGGK